MAAVDGDLVKITGMQVTIPGLPAGTQNPWRIRCLGETVFAGTRA